VEPFRAARASKRSQLIPHFHIFFIPHALNNLQPVSDKANCQPVHSAFPFTLFFNRTRRDLNPRSGHFLNSGATNMSARAIRRAAERQAATAARQAAHSQNPSSSTDAESAPTPVSSISEAQLAANRANAQKSHGPSSAAGRAISALNALKTALTGLTVLLPSDDVAAYQRHSHIYEHALKPVGDHERDLVQSVIDTLWRLRRIQSLEQTVFAKGRLDFAELFADADPAQRGAFIDLHTFEVQYKTLHNLQIQDARLGRRYEKVMAELRAVQQARRQQEQKDLVEAASCYLAAKKDGETWTPEENGFEISTAVILEFLAENPGFYGTPRQPKSTQAAASS
jgi:hypothetical protein